MHDALDLGGYDCHSSFVSGNTSAAIDWENLRSRALARDSAATLALIEALVPVVRARAYGVLARRSHRQGRDPRQELDDLAQEILATLFADDGRVLRGWDVTRGMSLPSYVGLFAERRVLNVLRSGRRSPWSDDPTDAPDLDAAAGTTREPEGDIASREIFEQLWARLKTELTPKGLLLFRALIVEDRPVESICEELEMSADAVYAWRSRMMKRVRRLMDEISTMPASDPALPVGSAKEEVS